MSDADVPLSVKRSLPCLYRYEEPKPAVELVKELTPLGMGTGATPQGSTLEDAVLIVPSHGTTASVETADMGCTSVTAREPLDLTSPTPGQGSVTSTSGAHSKRKRITPTVVGSLGSQTHAHLLSGNVLHDSQSRIIGSSSGGASGSASGSASGNGCPTPTIPSSTGTDEPAERSENATPHNLSPSTSPSHAVSDGRIAFPAISPPILTSNAREFDMNGVEIKKVRLLSEIKARVLLLTHPSKRQSTH